jgi:hypothetical protein
MAAFAEGGFTGVGPKTRRWHRPPWRVRRARECVSRLGLDWFESAAMGLNPVMGQDPTASPRALNQKLNVYLDRRAWIAASRDDIEAIAIDAMQRSGWRAV